MRIAKWIKHVWPCYENLWCSRGRVTIHAKMSTPSFEIPQSALLKRQPFEFNPQSKIGLLCIHGFSGSPYEVRPLGEHFARKGWRARGIVLPRHGRLPDALRGARWQEWPAAARVALDEMSAACEHVFVAGLSMGGLVTSTLAAQESAKPHSKLRACAMLATPWTLYDSRTKLIKLGQYFIPWFYPLKSVDFNNAATRAHIQRVTGISFDFDDAQKVAAYKNAIKLPTSAIAQLLRYIDHTRTLLPKVRTPMFVAQGTNDTVVARDSADVIGARLGSARKHVGWYDGFFHEMTLHTEAPRLFADIERFFDEALAQAGR